MGQAEQVLVDGPRGSGKTQVRRRGADRLGLNELGEGAAQGVALSFGRREFRLERLGGRPATLTSSAAPDCKLCRLDVLMISPDRCMSTTSP